MKGIFGFKVHDVEEDEPWSQSNCMLYTRKENILIPVSGDFRRGLPPISYDQAIEFLTQNRIKKVTTFDPDSDVVGSFPYEIREEEDFKACEADGLWYRFPHEEILEGSNLEKLMKNSGINLITLSPEEERELNGKLEFHE